MIEKFCECGCGQIAPVSNKTDNRAGWQKGKPKRFIPGHNNRGEKCWQWKGGISRKSFCKNRIARIKAELAMGKPLPDKAIVHHVDENILNDNNSNLVICQNNGYHFLLHQRMRALKACGYAHWRKCWICGKWDDPENLYVGKQAYHRPCSIEYKRRRRAEK